jgi:hypothetical protein
MSRIKIEDLEQSMGLSQMSAIHGGVSFGTSSDLEIARDEKEILSYSSIDYSYEDSSTTSDIEQGGGSSGSRVFNVLGPRVHF